jgi:hypothetical protein
MSVLLSLGVYTCISSCKLNWMDDFGTEVSRRV